MRPLRLEVEGFTCYRDRQDPLEFGGLSLFAIAGPTGAGKSSILDTMLYALYGEVPRIGKQGIGEVISQGRDVLSVCLDFGVQGRTYRVSRRVKRGKKGALATLATLAEMTEGGERNIADQVRPVNDAVIRLLGLDYSAFTQTVVLPQGEFARFLKSDPKGQREILQHLLGHDVFQRMRADAEQRCTKLHAELCVVEGQVCDHEGHTEEALAARRLELDAAREALRSRAEERAALDRQVQESRRRRQLTQECEHLKKERARLNAGEPGITRARAELARARTAAHIGPRLEAFTTATRRSQQAREDRDRAAATVSDLATRQVVAEQHAEAATDAARRCGEIQERIRRIDEMKGDLDRRRTLTSQLQQLARCLPATERHAKETRHSRDAAQAVVDAARRALEAQHAAVAGIGYDDELHQLVDEVWTQVVQVRALIAEVSRLGQDLQVLETDYRHAERDASTVRRGRAAAAAAADADGRAAATAAAALATAQTRHQAAALRADLHAGDDCPVCLQSVISVPKSAAPPQLAALIQGHRAAEARAEDSKLASRSADQRLAAAEARLTTITTARAQAAAKVQERRAAQAVLETAIVAALTHTSAGSDPTEALSWVETRRAALREAHQARARLEDLVRRAETAVHQSSVGFVAAEIDARRAAEKRAEAIQQHGACATELDAVVHRIRAVSAHADPAIEREALAARVVALQTKEQSTRATLAHLRQAAAVAAAALVAATTAAGTAQADGDRATTALSAALGAAGFTTAAEAGSATRTDAQVAALEATIRTYDDARVVVMRRLLDVEPQIRGREVDATALATAEARVSDAGEAWQRASVAVADLEGECGRLAAAVAKRRHLIIERDALRARHSVTAEMATDLKGDAFQEYLLEEAFRGVVTGASVRMRQISNRYSLEWEAGDFYVVDDDNAGERRRAETLSGGETFIASLCLALQLSDEVLRTSGALQMDSLFIDEGFGTLDADALGEVTDAMEALRQEGGRLIGVISHRPELTDRLPGCIRIEKGAGESRWRLERVG